MPKMPRVAGRFDNILVPRQSIEGLISHAALDYHAVSISSECFRSVYPRTESIPIELFYFEEVLRVSLIRETIRTIGYRPITLVELISLSIAAPRIQRDYQVVSLAQCWRGRNSDLFIPLLWGSESQRFITLLVNSILDSSVRIPVTRV